MFGKPDSDPRDRGVEYWDWGGTFTARRGLVVYYDESGVVRRYEYKPLPSNPCFIATAAYGSEECTEVVLLRHFRDTVLASSIPGRAFTRCYYRLAPSVAAWLRRRPLARRLTRFLLDRLVEVVRVGVRRRAAECSGSPTRRSSRREPGQLAALDGDGTRAGFHGDAPSEPGPRRLNDLR